MCGTEVELMSTTPAVIKHVKKFISFGNKGYNSHYKSIYAYL